MDSSFINPLEAAIGLSLVNRELMMKYNSYLDSLVISNPLLGLRNMEEHPNIGLQLHYRPVFLVLG